MAGEIIKNGDSYNHGTNHREGQVHTRSEIAALETKYGTFAPGSLIYVEDEKFVSMKQLDGTWDAAE